MTPLQAAAALGLATRGTKIACPHGHRKGIVWCSADAKRWKCHDCGAFGDAADLARIVGGMSYADAKAWAGGEAPKPAPMPFPAPLHVAESARLAEELDRHHNADLLRRWCDSRALPAMVAKSAGVRACAARVADGHPMAVGKEGRPWWPVSAGMVGTFWPCYHPGFSEHPLAWRFRPLQPVRLADGRVVKCIGMKGDMVTACPLVARGVEKLIICEGEPDWLAWCTWRTEAAVVGLVAGRWRGEWAAFGRECRTWAWVGHECDHESQVREKIAESAAVHGAKLVVRTVPESYDWADRWRK